MIDIKFSTIGDDRFECVLQGSKLYITVTMKNEAGIASRPAIAQRANDNIRDTPASEIRVADWISEVKDITGDLVKYFPDALLNEEQNSKN